MRARRSLALTATAIILAALSACGSKGSSASVNSTANDGAAKLIILELSFPCGMNDYATQLCAGATDAGKKLPNGYKVQIKTGQNFADTSAYNSLIQTSLQLKPAGIIVFPNGPAAQTPILNQACNQGVKVVIIDSPANDVKCQSSIVGANHEQMGTDVGKWLAAHPASSKEVGIVSNPPGQYASADARVKGFTDAVTAAGYHVVASASTDLSLAQTRTAVTNMLTAHPNIGAVFGSNAGYGQGAMQALKTHPDVMLLTLDVSPADIPNILNGDISADASQDPYAEGTLAVENIMKAIQGQDVQKTIYTPSVVVDKTNANEWLAAHSAH
jgi:ribose transport system substrate-binding protein